MIYKEGDKVVLKNSSFQKKDNDRKVFKVFGYANPGYDDLVYLIDGRNEIITVDENQIELYMEPMKYKDFISTPAWSEEDQCYYGHLEGILALVSWEAEEYNDCMKEFQSAVEDYLAFCKDVGLDPKESMN